MDILQRVTAQPESCVDSTAATGSTPRNMPAPRLYWAFAYIRHELADPNIPRHGRMASIDPPPGYFKNPPLSLLPFYLSQLSTRVKRSIVQYHHFNLIIKCDLFAIGKRNWPTLTCQQEQDGQPHGAVPFHVGALAISCNCSGLLTLQDKKRVRKKKSRSRTPVSLTRRPPNV